MSRVVVIGALAESLVNFRGALLRDLADAGHLVTAMAPERDAAVVARLASWGVTFEQFPVRRSGLNPIREVQTLVALRRALRRLRPDIVLAYTIKPVIWGGFALRSLPDARFYALITGLGYGFHGPTLPRRLLSGVLTRLYRAALARASAVIFQNPDNRAEFLARHIVPADRCVIVDGSGVDMSHFRLAPLPDGPPAFLLISRLLKDKGLREYADAAAIVKRRYPDAVFRLLGPPDPSPDAIAMTDVTAWHRAGTVEYLGAASDVRPFIRQCHVYVLPSYHEGMPRSVLEAMATGRPVLTTDVPGCRETVIEGVNGYLVPAGDAGALAERMMTLIAQRGDWPRMAAESRRLAERRFDVAIVNREMLRLMAQATVA